MNLDGDLPIPTHPAQISSPFMALSYFGGGNRGDGICGQKKGWEKLDGG